VPGGGGAALRGGIKSLKAAARQRAFHDHGRKISYTHAFLP
jgi:hypothetical protein